jgi:diguanylate cyclase (GGDEF)-like protein
MLSRIVQPLILPNPFERGANDFWRVRLINAYLVLTVLVFTFFAVFNILVVKLYANAFADIIGLTLALATVMEYRKNRNVGRTSSLVVLNIYLISLAIIMLADKGYGILFWSIFAPIFSLFLLGRWRGLLATAVYYAILLSYLSGQLGEGLSMHLFVEFVVVSLVLIAVVYHYELNRSEAYDLIHKASVEDALTGLYNRRWFNKCFESEYHRAERNRLPFTFFIMDIDHFKRYNDCNGHDKGDEVLRQVAQVLSERMRRSGDDIFRLGGEEFGGIISSDAASDAQAYVESIRHDIEALGIAIEPGAAEVVTASFGLTITDPGDPVPLSRIYRKTDQALYRAKEKGRNRVETEHVRTL